MRVPVRQKSTKQEGAGISAKKLFEVAPSGEACAAYQDGLFDEPVVEMMRNRLIEGTDRIETTFRGDITNQFSGKLKRALQRVHPAARTGAAETIDRRERKGRSEAARAPSVQ